MLVALTGGIGSGKSTVAARFRELGAHVIDADRVARDVVDPGTAGLSAVAQAFGPHLIRADGSLDRPALGRIVFGDDQARERLNAIVHPLVRAETRARIMQAAPGQTVVYDVPLLVEAPSDLPFDAVVVVSAPPQLRVERLVRHRGMTAEDAWARVRAQATEAQRLAIADHVVDASGTIEHTLAEADRVWRAVHALPDGEA